MEKRKSPFRKPSEEEKALADKQLAALEKARKETEALAVKCINHEDFVKYKEKYIARKELTIEMLINYVEPDPMKYAFEVRVQLANLYQLKLLLDNVQNDNRPKGRK